MKTITFYMQRIRPNALDMFNSATKRILPLHILPRLYLYVFVLILFPNALVHAASGWIEGTLTDEHGQPAYGAHVSAKSNDPLVNTVRQTVADRDGKYSIYSLAPGDWKLEFEPTNYTWDIFQHEWYNDTADEATADTVAVLDGQATVVDATLARNGQITGRLWSAIGVPQGACVDLYKKTSLALGETPDQHFVASTPIDADGYFTFDGLYPIDYTLFYRDCAEDTHVVLDEWHGHEDTYAQAVSITLSANDMRKNISVYTVPLESLIRGRIVNQDAQPVPDICVEFGLSNNIPATYYPYRIEHTDSDGWFMFDELAYGDTYYWVAYDCDGVEPVYFRSAVQSKYMSEWGKRYIHYTAPDMLLVRESTISGTVTNRDGAGIPGISVTIKKPGSYALTAAYTRADGTYTIPGLLPLRYGGYEVGFACNGFCTYDPQTYPDIQVINTDNTHITGVDAVLRKKTSIRGIIADAHTNFLIPGIVVELYKDDVLVKKVATYGNFGLASLTAGEYTLHFVDEGYGCWYSYCQRYPNTYQDHWYRQQRDQSTATTIELQEGDNRNLEISMLPWGQYFSRPVTIDVRPESSDNKIQCDAHNAVIPVALYSTSDFDATTVLESTIAFGPAGAALFHRNAHTEDVNDDGLTDLVMHFKFGDTGLACDDTEVNFSASTIDGQSLVGSDSIELLTQDADTL